MAHPYQELQNAIQAMNKIVALRVVQKKNGETVPDHIVEQIVETSDVAEMIQFIDTTIASEKEKKLTPHDSADNSYKTGLIEETTRTSPDKKTEVTNQPEKALPVDASKIQRKIQPKRNESAIRSSTDVIVGKTDAGEVDIAESVERHLIARTAPSPSSVEKPEPPKASGEHLSGIEVLEAGIEGAVTRKNDDHLSELTITSVDSGEVPTEPLPEKLVPTNPPELVTSDDLSGSDELVDDSKTPVRLLVLCVLLIALLSVFVTLNLSEIETLLLQWFSRVENWIMNL